MAVLRRMAHVVDGLAPAQVHVVVSHGDSIRIVLAHLQGLAPNDAPWVEVPNGAVIRFDGAFTWLNRSPSIAVPGQPHREQIKEMLIDRARAGKRVVRLKGGDGYVFGGNPSKTSQHHGPVLHRRLERPLPPLRVDEDRRGDPRDC